MRPERRAGWSPQGAARVLVFGGIALVIAGMLLGDVFAVFVLHQNAARIGDQLSFASAAVVAGDAPSAAARIQDIGGLLENRGTKVDAHVHSIDFGYLALLLAVLQPWVLLPEKTKTRLAWLLMIGAWTLPVGVFLIHYVGLAYSPLQSIGWASILADAGGALVALAAAGELVGLVRCARASQPLPQNPWLTAHGWAARVLLTGGTLLVLAGFVYGAWYSAIDLYRIENSEAKLLQQIVLRSSDARLGPAQPALAAFGDLQAEKAVKIAAHAHIIEFGFLAMMLALVQPLVFLQEQSRRGWAVVLLAGSVLLPISVLLEIRFGLIAGGVADFGGLLVIVALAAMAVGVLRHDGAMNSAQPGGA